MKITDLIRTRSSEVAIYIYSIVGSFRKNKDLMLVRTTNELQYSLYVLKAIIYLLSAKILFLHLRTIQQIHPNRK